MAIDYMILFPCMVREHLPSDKLLGLLKARKRAQAALAAVRERHPELSEETALKEWKVGGTAPEGAEHAQPIGDVLAEVNPQLDAQAAHCEGCLARVRDTPFGCCGHVSYPINVETEAWLLCRLPEDPKAPSLKALMGMLDDLGIQGRQIDALRHDRTYYEGSAPVIRKWGSWLSRRSVSSSQVLQLLMTLDQLKPELLPGIAKMLWVPDVPPTPKKHPPTTPEDGIAQMRGLLAAVVIAGRTHSQLYIDG